MLIAEKAKADQAVEVGGLPRRVPFRLPTFAAYVSEHPLLAGRGVNGEEVLYVFAAVGQYLRAHPEHVGLFTQALLTRAGMTTAAAHGGRR